MRKGSAVFLLVYHNFFKGVFLLDISRCFLKATALQWILYFANKEWKYKVRTYFELLDKLILIAPLANTMIKTRRVGCQGFAVKHRGSVPNDRAVWGGGGATSGHLIKGGGVFF
jgi:hypothetical protein